MEKTLAVLLQEHKEELLNKIIHNFEKKSSDEIKSNMHSYNDCAVIAKMWLMAAEEVKGYK
jgi:hypothetical protein